MSNDIVERLRSLRHIHLPQLSEEAAAEIESLRVAVAAYTAEDDWLRATETDTMKDSAEQSNPSTGSTGRRHEFSAWVDTSRIRNGVIAIARLIRRKQCDGRVPLGIGGPLFSTRMKIQKAAQEWCKDAGVKPTPLNVVTALSSMGLLANGDRIREWADG